MRNIEYQLAMLPARQFNVSCICTAGEMSTAPAYKDGRRIRVTHKQHLIYRSFRGVMETNPVVTDLLQPGCFMSFRAFEMFGKRRHLGGFHLKKKAIESIWFSAFDIRRRAARLKDQVLSQGFHGRPAKMTHKRGICALEHVMSWKTYYDDAKQRDLDAEQGPYDVMVRASITLTLP